MAINKTSRKERKSSGTYSKIFGIFAAILIIALLVISGPAQAFVLDLTSDKSSVSKGENVVFNASIDIDSNEDLAVKKLVLELIGPETVSCEFNVDGSIIVGCKGITIKRITNGTYLGYGYNHGEYSGYGYNFGYGYGYNGKLEYEITLASDNYQTGLYSTTLRTYIGNEIFSKTGNSLTISSSGSSTANYYNIGEVKRVCSNSWQCTEWSSCSDGKQTRTCSQRPNCYMENMPEQERVCVIDLKVNSNLNNGYDTIAGTINSNDLNGNSGSNNNGNSEPGETRSTNAILSGFLSGITGAVIGSSSQSQTVLWIVLMFIIVLVGLLIALLIVRAIRNSRRRRKIRELNKIRYIPPKN